MEIAGVGADTTKVFKLRGTRPYDAARIGASARGHVLDTPGDATLYPRGLGGRVSAPYGALENGPARGAE